MLADPGLIESQFVRDRDLAQILGPLFVRFALVASAIGKKTKLRRKSPDYFGLL